MTRYIAIFFLLIAICPSFAATFNSGKGEYLLSGKGDGLLKSKRSKFMLEGPKKPVTLANRETVLRVGVSLSGKHNYTMEGMTPVPVGWDGWGDWGHLVYEEQLVTQDGDFGVSGNVSVGVEQYHYLNDTFALGYGLEAVVRQYSYVFVEEGNGWRHENYKKMFIAPVYIGGKYRFGIKEADYWYAFLRFGANIGNMLEASSGQMTPYYAVGLGKKIGSLFFDITYSTTDIKNTAEHSGFSVQGDYRTLAMGVSVSLL